MPGRIAREPSNLFRVSGEEGCLFCLFVLASSLIYCLQNYFPAISNPLLSLIKNSGKLRAEDIILGICKVSNKFGGGNGM